MRVALLAVVAAVPWLASGAPLLLARRVRPCTTPENSAIMTMATVMGSTGCKTLLGMHMAPSKRQQCACFLELPRSIFPNCLTGAPGGQTWAGALKACESAPPPDLGPNGPISAGSDSGSSSSGVPPEPKPPPPPSGGLVSVTGTPKCPPSTVGGKLLKHGRGPYPKVCPAMPTAEQKLFKSVCLAGGTENNGNRCHGLSSGVMRCQCCDNPLFDAKNKCESNTGWPSFTMTLKGGACVRDTDEVICSKCGAHLGDYFHSAGWTSGAGAGPHGGGECYVGKTPSRFCIDGICLKPPKAQYSKVLGTCNYGGICRLPAFKASKGGGPCAAPKPAGAKVKIYVGDGCFWHTQYDMYLVERAAPFSRSNCQITSVVGFAGGTATSKSGEVCYHADFDPNTTPPLDSDYGTMGFAEGVELELDASKEVAQFTAVMKKLFTSYVKTTAANGYGPEGEWQRLDAQDGGADYRSIVGIPGGVKGPLFKVITTVAKTVPGWKIVAGKGGSAGTQDEGVLYVYDSVKFPFYRGEQYHQFHVNSVLGRAVPDTYTKIARQCSIKNGRINPTCGEKKDPGTSNVVH